MPEETVMADEHRPIERGVEAASRTYLFYDARDIALYVFSLAIVWGGAWLAFASAWSQALFTIALLYLTVVFILKRGARPDWSTLPVIARGLLVYPGRVIRTLRTWKPVRPVCAFGVAMLAELCAKRYLASDSLLLRPFPYLTVFLVTFMGITTFRTAILIAHLRRAAHVREVLESSPWKHEMRGLGVIHHILQAYVTGLISHACYLIPALIFWRLTAPTYAREAVLLLDAVLVLGFRSVRHGFPTALQQTLVRAEVIDALTSAHTADHKSRFNFAVLHGHHHDAIPSALMAAGESGFVESIDRGISYLTFLGSAIWTLCINALMTAANMVGHQYIPGVYPYSKYTVQTKLHHVVHHYGSLRPLGLGGLPSYVGDVRDGYDPTNGKVRWFLEVAAKHGEADPATAEEFVRI